MLEFVLGNFSEFTGAMWRSSYFFAPLSWTQWAAVSSQRWLNTDAPHTCPVPLMWRLTCQGHSPSIDAWPPTMRELRYGLIPHSGNTDKRNETHMDTYTNYPSDVSRGTWTYDSSPHLSRRHSQTHRHTLGSVYWCSLRSCSGRWSLNTAAAPELNDRRHWISTDILLHMKEAPNEDAVLMCHWRLTTPLLTSFTFGLIRSVEAVIFPIALELLWDTATVSAGKLSWFAFSYKEERISPTPSWATDPLRTLLHQSLEVYCIYSEFSWTHHSLVHQCCLHSRQNHHTPRTLVYSGRFYTSAEKHRTLIRDTQKN